MRTESYQAGTGLWRRAGVRRLLIVSFLGFTSFALTLAALPSAAVRGGASPGVAGGVITVMLASTVLTQLTLPWLLSRFGTGAVFVAGLVALGGPAPLLALWSEPAPLLAISAVRGAGFAVLTVVGATMTLTVAGPDRHGESVGLQGLAIALPNLVGVPAGVALTQQGLFWWVAVLAASPLAAIPAALALSREHGVHPVNSRRDVATTSHRATVVAVLPPSVVLFAATLAAGGLMTFLPIARPDGALATLALLLLGLMTALCRWRAGILADRLASRLLLPAAVAAAVSGMVLTATGLEQGWDPAVLVGVSLFGLGYGAVLNLTLVVAFASAGVGRTTTASSAWNAAFDAGTGIGAGLLGVLAALGLSLPWGFLATAVLMLATAPLSVPSRRRADCPR